MYEHDYLYMYHNDLACSWDNGIKEMILRTTSDGRHDSSMQFHYAIAMYMAHDTGQQSLLPSSSLNENSNCIVAFKHALAIHNQSMQPIRYRLAPSNFYVFC